MGEVIAAIIVNILGIACVTYLGTEVLRLRRGIRKHRDQHGDDRCWLDDRELYSLLPEGYTPPAEDTAVELENCKRFLACRRDPATIYVSPQRRIEQLELENSLLKKSG